MEELIVISGSGTTIDSMFALSLLQHFAPSLDWDSINDLTAAERAYQTENGTWPDYYEMSINPRYTPGQKN